MARRITGRVLAHDRAWLSLIVRSRAGFVAVAVCGCLAALASAQPQPARTVIGSEKAIPRHLQDGEEFNLSLTELVRFGEKLFTANWTDQDGAGRPLSKGTGQPLTDRSQSLAGAHVFNRLSGPDANSCQGCHIGPYQLAGGGGDFVANAFVMADRFDGTEEFCLNCSYFDPRIAHPSDA